MTTMRLSAGFAACVAAAALGSSSCGTSTAPPGPFVMPRVGHVFIIVMENKDYAQTFAPNSTAPYLAKTLPAQGALLTQYYGIAHNSLPNYIAMLSGQSPNPVTQSDCQGYQDFQGPPVLDADGQITGQGCVYPTIVKTIADQLQDAHLTWKGYMEDMGNDPTREAATCGHPALNSQDGTQTADVGDQYAARHNPFVYFHSIIDSPVCDQNDVALTRLQDDLATVATTPNFVFITPNLCSDGHDEPQCVDGASGGLHGINRFLQQWVPQILNSPAYQLDGLLMILFDESDSGATGGGDDTACCGQDANQGPNSPQNGIQGPGGGLVGAVFLSPFIKPGTVSAKPYNHYSMLRSVEDMFGLPHLGYAGLAGLEPFGGDVFASGQ